jgi:hypothetical protein
MIRIFIRDKRWGEVDVVNGKLHVVSDDLTPRASLIAMPTSRRERQGTHQEVYDSPLVRVNGQVWPGVWLLGEAGDELRSRKALNEPLRRFIRSVKACIRSEWRSKRPSRDRRVMLRDSVGSRKAESYRIKSPRLAGVAVHACSLAHGAE